jgi:hypothetical protein
LAPRRRLFIALLTIAAFPLTAATVITRTGTPAGSVAGVTSLAASWTQTGTTYSGVTVAITVQSTNGAPASGNVYLTNALGSAATAVNLLALAPIAVSSPVPVPVILSFPPLTLPPGTYYLVLSNATPNLGWAFVEGGAVEALGPGGSSNIDRVDLATPTPAFPPSAATFVPVTAGGSSKVMLFAVTGNPGPPLTITLIKSFGAVAIPIGGATTLTFTIVNPNPTLLLTAIAFSDPLPAGLAVATPNGLTGSCPLPAITAAGNLISVANLVLPPGAVCSFTVNVRGLSEGTQSNITSPITAQSTAGIVTGPPASSSIFVGAAFLVSYAANLASGESYVNLSNNGSSGAPLLGPGFGGAVGNICVNAYAFSPDEQLISCCSCLITPNGLANLGVTRDLTQKTLTGVIPTSVVIKLVAGLAGAGGTGTTCTNSAATITAAQLAGSTEAWSTTLHPDPASAFRVTETPFSAGTLSSGELASLTGRCASILGNGSGFGICRSCQQGALGAGKQ